MIRPLITFLVLYVVLMVPWPGVQEAYHGAFVQVGATVFGGFGARSTPVFEAFDEKGQKADTTINVLHRPTGGTVWMRLSSREIGYFPTAVVTALILATPATWRKRLTAWLIGIVAVYGFVGIRLLIIILFYANRDLAAMSGDPTFWQKGVSQGIHFIGTGHALSYIIPIIIWALVSIRRQHIEMALGSSAANSTSE